MKKLFFITMLLGVSLGVNAQWGFTANYLTATPNLEYEGFSLDGESYSGFGVGVTYLFDVTDQIQARPELMYVNYGTSEFSSSYSTVMIPVPLIYAINDDLNVQAGLALTYALDEISDDDVDNSSSSIGFVVGAGYSITERVYGQIRYIPQLTNSVNDPDASLKINNLSFTLGYNL
jgi:hypothetical protein